MKTKNLNSRSAKGKEKSCPTGGCGGPGLCPGVALLLAYLTGTGVTLLTGLNWLGWPVGVPVAVILITGAWHFPRAES